MKILIVEDNQSLRKSMLEYIRAEGYAADVAPDGVEGLYKAINWEYDLLVLDVMMPGLDGWQLLEGFRRSRNTPVIMVTARDAVEERIRGLDLGADDYIIKPFEMKELMARIRAALRRTGGEAMPQLQAGPIRLDNATRTAYLHDKPIDFSAREYSLLELFMKKRGELLTRSFIYEHLFDDRDNSLSNMLDVYVYRLRSKLGKTVIQTRRGEGYLFIEEACGAEYT